MVTALYFVTFLAALAMTGVNIFRNKKANTLFVLMSLCITLNCLGRYLLSIAPTLETALWANKMLYVGACYTAPVVILVVAQLCGLRAPVLLRVLLFSAATVNYAFVLTTGHSGLYYETVELASAEAGYHYLVKSYGPAHLFYPIFTIACAAVLLFYLILAIRNRHMISSRAVTLISALSIATVVSYVLEKIFSSAIDWHAIGFLLVAISMTCLFDRMNMYDMTINLAGYTERLRNYGYIAFDSAFRYVNANAFARELFPQIAAWQVDSRVAPDDSLVYREIAAVLPEWSISQTERTLAIGDRYFELNIRDLVYGPRSRVVGYLVELEDETAEKRYLSMVESYNTQLEAEVQARTAEILRIQDKMIVGMAAMIESRDNSTGGHIRRTSDVVRVFGAHLLKTGRRPDLTADFLSMVSKAAPMHDLGKIAIDDSILRKQGRFTGDEYERMKEHAAEGARIVHEILDGVEREELVQVATNVAFYHHEKWDGSGYPKGLRGEEIPVEARIMALADVFDTLVSRRCYKEPLSYEETFAIIAQDLGSHFDPDLGREFIACRPALEQLYDDAAAS